jgi:hypothetical protein
LVEGGLYASSKQMATDKKPLDCPLQTSAIGAPNVTEGMSGKKKLFKGEVCPGGTENVKNH